VDGVRRLGHIVLMEAPSDLQLRAEAGDPVAQVTLARTLLGSGESRQDQFFEAIALVDSASASGHGDATALSALFAAMGVARPQSWPLAFDLLQLAAEQGSRSAQQQLMFLANPDLDPQVPVATGGARVWAETRAAISLDRLLHHPERRALCSAPRIRIIEGFASAAECRWLIDRARTMLKAALIFDVHGRHVADPGRSNKGTDFQLGDMDVVIEIIRARIAAATRIPVPVFEPTQVLHYTAGQEFKRHIDALEPTNPHHREQLRTHGQRIATFLIYLNQAFEGGETEFSAVGLRYRGNTGDALFWPNVDGEGTPDPLTLHAGLPPTSGEKWLLSQWIRDRPPPSR